MSQETPTDLPEMPSTAPPVAEGSTALSLSEVDQRSASRMLRVLVIFGWGMAAAVVVSALLGFGTPLSNTLAFCWFAALTLLLLLWSKLTLQWHRGVALAMLCLVIARWAVAWLYADAADAMVGVVTGLLYAPLLVAVTTLIWDRVSPYIGVSTGLIMGVIAFMGSAREALSGVHLNDWRIAPLILCVYGLFSWLLRIWVQERDALRQTTERAERLRKAANTDTLTGIANRRVAERTLGVFAAGQRRYAVMMIDIDHFKSVNDQHGHDTGDRILQCIAEALQGRMRVQDTVARWGGEEFLVIVESVTRDEAASIAESLRALVEQGTAAILKTTISIGVAHSDVGQGVDHILKRADEGLYAAKNSGRNKVVTV